MGLTFFQGTRGQAVKKDAASDAYRPPPPSAPPAPSNIQHAVPIAYVPPLSSPTASAPMKPAVSQQQAASINQQLVPAENTNAAPPASAGIFNTNRHTKSRSTRQEDGAMIISNAELDQNLRMWQRATLGGRTLPHKLFIIFSIITILTAVNNIIAHTLAVLFYGNKEDPMEQILRFFTIGLYFLVILIESNKSELVQKSFVFQHWAARGVFYTFLGVLGCVEYDVGQQNYGGSYRDRYNQYNYGRNNNIVIYVPSGEDAFELYIWATSWIMLLVGLVYTMLGACCMHQKYQQLEAHYQQRQRTAGQQPYHAQYP
jgi:hypothetical protein